MAGDILVAKATAAIIWQGQTFFIQEGVTLARQGHPMLESVGEMFGPLRVHFDVQPEPEPSQQPEPPADAEPDAKAVRAWAKEQGVDVPARGKLPAELVEAYKAAQADA